MSTFGRAAVKRFTDSISETPGPTAYSVDQSSIVNNDPNKHFGFLEKKERFKDLVKEHANPEDTDYASETSEVKPAVRKFSGGEKEELGKLKHKMEKLEEQYIRKLQLKEKDFNFIQEKLSRAEQQYQNAIKEKNQFQSAALVKEKELAEVSRKLSALKLKLDKEEKISAHFNEKVAMTDVLQRKVEEMEKLQGKQKKLADRKMLHENETLSYDLQKYKSKMEALEAERLRLDSSVLQLQQDRNTLKSKLSALQTTFENEKEAWRSSEDKYKEEYREIKKRFIAENEKSSLMKKEFTDALSSEQQKLREAEKRNEALKTSHEAQKNAYLARIQNLETDLDITERALTTKEDNLAAMVEEVEVLKQTITKRKLEYEEEIKILKNLITQKDRDLDNQGHQIAERLKKIQTEKMELQAQRESDADKLEKTILSLQSTIQQYQADQASSKKDYEFQIRNYEQQTTLLKQELAASKQELQLQNDNCTKLRVEQLKYEKMIKEHRESSDSTVSELKAKFAALSDDYQLLSKKNTTENQNHTKELFVLKSEIERITNDFEAKIAVLNQDNHELSEKCAYLEEEHNNLKNQYEQELFVFEEKLAVKNTHLEDMNVKYDSLIAENNSTCMQFERQVATLEHKVQELNIQLKETENQYMAKDTGSRAEIERLHRTLNQMQAESKLREDNSLIQIEECKKEIDKLRFENETLNQKCVSKDEALAKSCKERDAERVRMQKNCDALCDKLNAKDDIIQGRDQKLAELTNEISSLKQSRQLTEINHKKALEELGRQVKEKDLYGQSLFKKIERLEKELQDEKSSVDDKDAKMAKLRKELADSQSDNLELSEKNSQLDSRVNKLEHVVQDQKDRLNDLESNCNSLETAKESEHRNYVNAMQQLRNLEVSNQDLLIQLTSSKSDVEKTKDSLSVARTKINELAEENEHLLIQVETLELAKAKTEKEIVDYKSALNEAAQESNALAEDKKALQRSLHDTKKELEEAVAANEFANNELSQSKQKEKKLEMKLHSLESKLTTESTDLHSVRKELDLTKSELLDKSESVDRLNTQLSQMKQDLSKANEKLSKTLEQLQDANICIAKNTEDMTTLKMQLQKASQENQSTSELLSMESGRVKELSQKLATCESDLKSVQHHNLELMESLSNQVKQFNECQLKLTEEIGEKKACILKASRLDEQCKTLQSTVAELESRIKSLNMEFSSSTKDHQSSIEMKERQVQSLTASLKSLEADYGEIQKKFSELSKQFSHEKFILDNQVEELKDELRSKNAKLTSCEEKINALTELNNLRTREHEELTAAHELSTKKMNDKFHTEREELQSRYATQLNEYKAGYYKEKADFEEKAKGMQLQIRETEAKLADYVSKFDTLNSEFNDLSVLNRNSSSEITRLNAQIENVLAEKATIERELTHVKELCSEYRNKVGTIELEAQKHVREVQELKAKLLHESELKAMAQNDYTELRETFKVKFNDLHELNKSLEKEKLMLSKKFDADVQKLSERLAEKTSEIQQLEMKLGTATGANERFELKLSNEISSREIKIKQMEAKLNEKVKETEKLSSSIANLMKEKEQLQNSLNAELKKEVEKHAESFKRRADAEKHELGLVIEELKAAESSKNAEIARLNSQLLTTMNDLETLKDAHRNQLEKFKQLGKLTAQEIQQVASEKASLYGHTNVNQKIKHLQKISEENLKLKAEKIELERDRDMHRRRALNFERELEAQRALGPNEKSISRVARNFKNRPPPKQEENAVVEEKENVVTQLGAASGGVSFMIE